MIQYATNKMIPELSQLWYLCFHDGEPYRSFYYDNLFKAEDTLVYMAEDKPAAMLTLLRAQKVQDGRLTPVRYVYAVATHPEYRRKGYAAALLAYANQNCTKNPVSDSDYSTTLLVPASKELFGYYGKLGYHTQYYLKHITVARSEENYGQSDILTSDLTASEYDRIRAEAFYKEGNVLWSVEALDYMIREIRFTGGHAVKMTLQNQECAAVYYVDGNDLVIKELAAPDTLVMPLIQHLIHMTDTDLGRVKLSADSQLEGEILPYGMAYQTQKDRHCYFNLSLD